MKKVVILQHRLLHYRTGLFEQLRFRCAQDGIEIQVVHGQATRREQAKRDEGSLRWAVKVDNRVWEVGERDLLWQPLPSALRGADLILIMQESRILSNYPLLLRRHFGPRKLAYWGHGTNLQSSAPHGWRERWKRSLVNRVDWWFAYTQSTVAILQAAGFPSDRITRLDNAIDTRTFGDELNAITDADMVRAKRSLGIGASEPVGLFCGSLYADKRLDFLVDAVDRIHANTPGFHCLVIGSGPYEQYMHQAAATRPWVHMLGSRHGLEKALYFRLGTFMLNPGAVGLHVVDAFCAGLVLATTGGARHGPERAYLRHGENALVTGDTPAEFAEGVLALLVDEKRLDQIRSTALADARRYTLDNMVSRFANGLSECLVHAKRR